MGFLENLKAGGNNKREVNFPGTSEKVYLRILSCQDYQDAHAEAEAKFQQNNIKSHVATFDMYEAEKDLHTLYRAVRTLEGKPLADNVHVFKTLLTQEEKNALIEQYEAFEQEVSPRIDKMSQKDFDILLDKVKKKPAEELLNISNIAIAKRLVVSLVSRQQN